MCSCWRTRVFIFRLKMLSKAYASSFCIMQSVSSDTIISPHCFVAHRDALKLKAFCVPPSFIPSFFHPYPHLFGLLLFLLQPVSFYCYLPHQANSVLLFFLSGTFVDWVQFPDDNGKSAERKPQRHWRRSILAPRLPAKMEGTQACAFVTSIIFVCTLSILYWF